MSLKEVVSIREILEILQEQDSEKKLRKRTLVAFILDVSKPKRVQGQGDYMQTIKIMDDSYNGYLTLFYFFKTIDEAGPFDTIGDIIFLKRYQYQLHNGEPQARRNSYKTSKLLLFDVSTLTLKFNPNESSLLAEEELDLIKKTSEISKSFFQTNSLINHYWYGSANDSYDVLLQVQEYRGEFVILQDQKNEYYQLATQSQIPIGTVLKIRNIQISEQNQVLVTDKSNILLLPYFCLDSQQFNQVQQTITKVNILLEQYEQVTIDSLTQIKRKYINQDAVPIIKIIQREIKEEFAVIQGQVQSVYPTSIKEALVFYNRLKSFSYSQAIENNLSLQTCQHCVQMQINLRDASLDGTNYVLQLLLFDTDEFLPFNITLDNIEYMEVEYQKVLERLLLSNDQLNDFVIEIIHQTEGSMYRIVDTKIVL